MIRLLPPGASKEAQLLYALGELTYSRGYWWLHGNTFTANIWKTDSWFVSHCVEGGGPGYYTEAQAINRGLQLVNLATKSSI